MSAEQAPGKARQTLKAVRELLEKAEDSTHKALEKAAPAVQRSIDSSLEAAAAGFDKTMTTIDGATQGDQLKLLKAYKKFLGGQADYIDRRIGDIEAKREKKQ